MSAGTLDRIAAILREQLALSADHPISPETRLVEDLACDSLDVVELTLFVEDEFGIEVSFDEAVKAATVGELAALVERRKVAA